jgi:hypothetical protein
MGWETRGNGRYYYRKQRVGGKVYSEYVGAGLLAEASAILDQNERDRLAATRATEREAQKADHATDWELDQLGNVIRTITAASLVAGGYHTHKGQWRRKRNDDGSNR